MAATGAAVKWFLGVMIKHRYLPWQDGDAWLGYLEKVPDYWVQDVG